MAYLLDANVFIQAKRLQYGFDFCPAFWDWIVAAHARGTVFSIEKVYGEFQAIDDELLRWADHMPSGFFLKPDDTVYPSFGIISAWANSLNYTPPH